MSLTNDFALLMESADKVRSILAASGAPTHCHEAFNELHAAVEAMALKVARSEAARNDKNRA